MARTVQRECQAPQAVRRLAQAADQLAVQAQAFLGRECGPGPVALDLGDAAELLQGEGQLAQGGGGLALARQQLTADAHALLAQGQGLLRAAEQQQDPRLGLQDGTQLATDPDVQQAQAPRLAAPRQPHPLIGQLQRLRGPPLPQQRALACEAVRDAEVQQGLIVEVQLLDGAPGQQALPTPQPGLRGAIGRRLCEGRAARIRLPGLLVRTGAAGLGRLRAVIRPQGGVRQDLTPRPWLRGHGQAQAQAAHMPQVRRQAGGAALRALRQHEDQGARELGLQPAAPLVEAAQQFAARLLPGLLSCAPMRLQPDQPGCGCCREAVEQRGDAALREALGLPLGQGHPGPTLACHPCGQAGLEGCQHGRIGHEQHDVAKTLQLADAAQQPGPGRLALQAEGVSAHGHDQPPGAASGR